MSQPNYYNTPSNVYNPMQQAQGQGPVQQNQQAKLMDGQIPGFSNMVDGGRIPVAEFVGLYESWKLTETQFGQAIVLHFTNCQVMESDAPWPYAEIDLQIRYSNNLRSGYGLFGESLAAALGMARESCDLEVTKNYFLHIVREDEHIYGQNQQTGEPMKGLVWHVVQAVAPGSAAPTPVRHQLYPPKVMAVAVAGVQGVQPAVGQGAAPVAPAQVVPQVPVAAQPAVVPQAVAPPVQQPVTVPVAPPPTTQPVVQVPPVNQPETTGVVVTATPEMRALELLNGKDRDTWTREVMNDQSIRGDATLFNAILNNQWLSLMMNSGRVLQNADGTFSVVA